MKVNKKQTILIGLLLMGVVLFQLSSSLAFDWNWLVSVFKKEVPSLEYTVKASGRNLRVYEFDTQGAPKQHCVVLLRPNLNTSPAMWCTKITSKEIEINNKLYKK